MPPVNRAKKRAYDEALKQYRPLSAGGASNVSPSKDEAYAVDGVWREVPATELDAAGRSARAKAGSDALYGEGAKQPAVSWPARPWDAETLRRAINAEVDSLGTNHKAVTDPQRRLLGAQLKMLMGTDATVTSFLFYLRAGVSTTDNASPEVVLALLKWLDLEDTETGRVPKKLSIVRTEAMAVVRARMKDLGQGDLFEEGGTDGSHATDADVPLSPVRPGQDAPGGDPGADRPDADAA
jgi:hypothetical protein